MFRRPLKTPKEVNEENPFLLSFSDLMAGLLVIFILALVVSMIELQKRKAELEKEKDKIKVTLAELVGSLEEIQNVQDSIASSLEGVGQRERSLTAMLEGIQLDLKEKGVAVVVAENGSVLRIPEQGLNFALGKYEIPTEFTSSATAIGKALAHALEQEVNRRMLDTVFIEGHTDAVQNSREMGNWGLSTYRAISLWNFWTTKPGQLAAMKDLTTIPAEPTDQGRPLISVSGYAETRSTHPPDIAGNLPPDRPEDRRIDIRFTLAASEKRKLQKLQDNLKTMKEKTDTLIQKLREADNAP
ncbi:MAG: OmpA/MotB family protein [Prosthecobacter sp.]